MAQGDKTYLEGFARFADTRLSGVEAAEYDGLGRSIAAYFRGEKASAQSMVTSFGQRREAFNEKELQHLQDLKMLFARLHVLQIVSAAATVLLMSILFVRKRFSLLGVALTAGLPLLIVLWAVLDFHSLFYCLHRILFPKNDLWLLDPRKDLLIQLMPLPLFTYLAGKLLLTLLPALLLPLAGVLLRRKEHDVR